MQQGLIRKQKDIIFGLFIILFNFALVVNAHVSAKEAPETAKAREQTCIVKQGLIILVEFPDIEHAVGRRVVQDRFFRKLNSYVKEMSYNKVCIGADVTAGWYQMPHPVSYYKISSRNLEVDKTRVKNLIRDAIDAVDKDVGLSKYSFVVIFMGAKREEYGMVGLCGYPGMLGWGTEEILETKSGQIIRGGIAIFCYEAHLGTLFHDIAHVLGGIKEGKRMVPCLYDHDLQAKPGPLLEVFHEAVINMGFWDPMSCHFYKRNMPPPGISSWTKMRLGWIDQSKIRVVERGQDTEIILGPLEDETSETLVVKIPLSETSYYLIENRQPIGFDNYLPGSGILIMSADDKIAECRKGKSPVRLINADPTMPHLEGAAFNIGKNSSFSDEKNGLKIQLLEKRNKSYKISISFYREGR